MAAPANTPVLWSKVRTEKVILSPYNNFLDFIMIICLNAIYYDKFIGKGLLMALLKFSRRAIIAVGAAIAFATSAISVTAQTPDDVLVVGQIAEPKSMDPATVTAVNDFRILMNIYDGLVRYKDGTLEVEPSLATSWTISDDGTVYTFKLRSGVKFHDGSALNASAVKFNFDRMLDCLLYTSPSPRD